MMRRPKPPLPGQAPTWPPHGSLCSQSYLDTGNRGAFANGGPAVQLHADFARTVWAVSSCAPLLLEGAALQAARRCLLERAGTLGHATTSNPALRLLLDGSELKPRITGRIHRFRLPAAARRVRLASRSAVPAHVRHDSNDDRRLGVAVSRLWLDRREASLDSPGLASGWHAPEPGWRWTDGDAVLELAGVRELELEVALTERYWLPRPRREATATSRRA